MGLQPPMPTSSSVCQRVQLQDLGGAPLGGTGYRAVHPRITQGQTGYRPETGGLAQEKEF